MVSTRVIKENEEREWREQVETENKKNITNNTVRTNFIDTFIKIETEINLKNTQKYTQKKGILFTSLHYTPEILESFKNLILRVEQLIPTYENDKISTMYALVNGLKEKIEKNKSVFEIKKNISQIRQLINK